MNGRAIKKERLFFKLLALKKKKTQPKKQPNPNTHTQKTNSYRTKFVLET